MKSRVLTIAVVAAVIAAAVAVSALRASARRWEEQKADRLRDFTHAERAVAWQRRAARSGQDESRLTQMEMDLQIARLQMIIFYTTKPLPFPYSAKEAAQLARWQQEAAAFRNAHPLPGTTAAPTPPFALFKRPLMSKPPGRRSRGNFVRPLCQSGHLPAGAPTLPDLSLILWTGLCKEEHSHERKQCNRSALRP